jgi:hypothetical protein
MSGVVGGTMPGGLARVVVGMFLIGGVNGIGGRIRCT